MTALNTRLCLGGENGRSPAERMKTSRALVERLLDPHMNRSLGTLKDDVAILKAEAVKHGA